MISSTSFITSKGAFEETLAAMLSWSTSALTLASWTAACCMRAWTARPVGVSMPMPISRPVTASFTASRAPLTAGPRPVPVTAAPRTPRPARMAPGATAKMSRSAREMPSAAIMSSLDAPLATKSATVSAPTALATGSTTLGPMSSGVASRPRSRSWRSVTMSWPRSRERRCSGVPHPCHARVASSTGAQFRGLADISGVGASPASRARSRPAAAAVPRKVLAASRDAWASCQTPELSL